jgi:RimJ/RimL family protein N-acetyltransferase
MLAEAGLDDITLWVLEGNQRARGFYEACGFKPDGTRQLLDIGGLVPKVRYQLAGPAVQPDALSPPAGPHAQG